MTFSVPIQVSRAVSNHPYPLIFATVSGAHLYGFASPDSDWDLRGVHLLPADEVLGLFDPQETIEQEQKQDGVELDLVTHDARKFFNLLLKRNGYVLEQLYSPLVVHTSPEHQELKEIAKSCITRYHSHHYLGFAATQWELFEKEQTRRIKPLLYTYRVLLTGIHLVNTGEVEANLLSLNEEFRMSGISELIARKSSGTEQSVLSDSDIDAHRREYERLRSELEVASERSQLPEAPSARAGLSDLLVRLRRTTYDNAARRQHS
jgi:predicted nucleotidyltransferase